MLIFDPVFSSIVWFYKKKTMWDFILYIYNKSYEFCAFAIKPDFRNVSESRELRRKNKNLLKAFALPSFSQKTRYIYWKSINPYRFFTVKISVPTNFMRFRLKTRSEIYQKEENLDLRTPLMHDRRNTSLYNNNNNKKSYNQSKSILNHTK